MIGSERLADLGYWHHQPNRFQRSVRRIAASRPGAWLLSKVLRLLDYAVMHVSRERTSLTAIVAGLPVVVLSTTGARSGCRRLTPLMGIPFQDSIAVAGANFGQPKTPSWVHNLAAHPEAVVYYRGRALPVRARQATDREYSEIGDIAALIYPPSTGYVERAGARGIRVYVLDPLPQTDRAQRDH